MKLMFLIESLGCGGAERQLVALANELGRRGHDVTVAVFRRGGDREQDLDLARVRLIDLKKESGRGHLSFFLRLWKLVRRERPNVLHGYLSAGNLAAGAVGLLTGGVRIYWGIRDSNIDVARYSFMTKLVRAAGPLLSWTADRIIVNSRAGLEFSVASGYPRRKLAHIPNGIATESFGPDRAAGEAVRRSWGLESRHRVVGLVGRIDPMKDHETFLRAAAVVLKSESEARFVCVGGGNEALRLRLAALTGELGLDARVRWIPPVTEMRAAYNAFDVYCSSSSFGEGFPNVVGEAMACGVPCVVTDIGDAALVVGSTAPVTPAGDAPRLATAILAQLRNPESGLAGRERIARFFSIAQLADRTEQALDPHWDPNGAANSRDFDGSVYGLAQR